MYKDKEEQKKANREAKQRQRQGMTKGAMDGMTSVGMTRAVTLLKRPNGADYDPDELMSNGEKRYMGPFSDGQVLDNTTVGLNLTPCNHEAMRAWATATLFIPTKYAQGCIK